MPESGQRSGGRDDAAASKVLVERFFFPAAAGYGAIAVPLSVHSMYGGAWAAPGLSSPLGHAHDSSASSLATPWGECAPMLRSQRHVRRH